MTEKTTEELAREWAIRVLHGGHPISNAVRGAAEYILEQQGTLPTLGEMPSWSNEHLLAEAVHAGTGELYIIAGAPGEDGLTPCINEQGEAIELYAANLALNGGKYRLKRIETVPTKVKHPEWLDTAQDYEDAPNGTIVADDCSVPYLKGWGTWISSTGNDANNSLMFKLGGRIRVLRWGWGEDDA